MLFLRTFGGLELDRNGHTLGPAAHQRGRLAILAVLAAAIDRGVSRDLLQALFWPESGPGRARNALNQALYALRRALEVDDQELTLGTTELRLNQAVIQTDVFDFTRLIESGALADAVALYRGPFLDGVHIKEAPEFERWVETERARLSALHLATIERLAEDAGAAGDHSAAAGWWRRRASGEPLSARVALRFMESLASAGDHEAAIGHAAVYAAFIRSELDADAAVEVEELAQVLRARRGAPARPASQRSLRPGAGEADEGVPDISRRAATTDPINPVDGATVGRRRFELTSIGTTGWRVGTAAGLLIVASLLVGSRLYGTRRERLSHPASTAAEATLVFPFRVDIADSSLAFLGDGIADLLNAALAQGAAHADGHALAVAWHEASANLKNPRDVTARATQRVGAQRGIIGTVVGNRQRISVSAEMISTSGRTVGSAVSVDGRPDSLLGVVARLASALLAGEATGDEQRLADLTTRSPNALRQYLAGLADMRTGQIHAARDAFHRALATDTSFALAALGIATAGGWSDQTLAQRMGKDFALGWHLRERLSPSDRALFDAAVGTYNPTDDSDAAALARWSHAAQLLPTRGDVAYEYGDRLFHVGAYLGIPDADGQALRAFDFAVATDSSQLVALGHLVELAIYRRDTEATRRLYGEYSRRDTSGDAADYLAWRVALATGDGPLLNSFERHLNSLSRLSLRRIAGMGQMEGIGVRDADAAMSALANRDLTPRDQARTLYRLHAFDLNHGDAGAAGRRLDQLESLAIGSADEAPFLGDALDLAVIDAVFSVGDSSRARVAVARLTQPGASRKNGTAQRHACTAEVWRATHGDTSRTAGTVKGLTSQDALADSAAYYGWQPRVCVALIEAALGVARGRGVDALNHADSIMAVGARGYGARFGNLWLARLFWQVGDRPRALRAASRRRRDWDNDVLYAADEDATIVTMARAMGDSQRVHAFTTAYESLRGAKGSALQRISR